MSFNWMVFPTLCLSVAMCAVGIVAARRSRKPRAVGVVLIVAALLAAPGVLMVAYYIHGFDSWRWFYVFRAVRGSELSAAGMGFGLGAALYNTRKFGFIRVAVWPGLVLAMLALLTVPYAKPLLAPVNLDVFRDRWAGRVCIQSTGSSCGAASTATVLRFHGFEVSEREIARECFTYRGGTENWYLARAFQRRGLKARFLNQVPIPDPLPVPCIAGVRLGVIGHFIVILEDRGETVITGDPLEGEREYSKAELGEEFDFTGFFLMVTRE